MEKYDRIKKSEVSESEFWDVRAEQSSEVIYYEGIVTTNDRKLYNVTKFAVNLMGGLKGKKLLECGCGFGGLSCFLAGKAAKVVAVDVSARSLRIAEEMAGRKACLEKISFIQMDCNKMSFNDQSFDHICGSNILHHVEDLDSFARAMSNLLKDGGKGVFVETSGDNRLLMFMREYVLPIFKLRKGSPSEHPLTHGEISELRKYFSEIKVYYPELVFFRLIASYFFNDFGPVRSFFEKIDTFLYNHVKSMRRHSYFKVIEFIK